MNRLFFCFAAALSVAVSCSDGVDKYGAEAVKPPVMGWSSWNAFMIDISDSTIMEQADLLVSTGLYDAGYDHVNVDDGFFGFRGSDGRMNCHPDRFPGGMKAVADHIHSLGMKAGIYSDAGNNTCGSVYNDDANGVGAGLYGHDVQDAELYFNEWGYDFIKIDYCGGQRLGLDERTRYERIREVVDSVAHRPVEINICRWAYPGTWVSSAGDSWRISEDIRPYWASIRNIVSKNLYLSAYARDGRYNDMDMLVVGYDGNRPPYWRDSYGLTAQEEQTHFAMWCMMSSPLLLGCDLRGIPDSTLELITNPELIALNQDPLGLQARVVQRDGGAYVLVKDLLRKRGENRAVALYNPTDSPVDLKVPLELLEYSGRVTLRDLCLREDAGSAEDVLEAEVPAHGIKVYRLGGKRTPAVRYEAEWAYIPDFTTIGTNECARVIELDEASAGAAVAGLGGSEGNCLVWDEVYVPDAGEYIIGIDYSCGSNMDFEVGVNGEMHPVTVGPPVGDSGSCKVVAKLNTGCNVVTMGNPRGEVPIIDCFTLIKK